MSYLYLAVKYLKNDKARTIRTILGVTLVAFFLYSGTWIFFSYAEMYWYQWDEFHVAIAGTDPDMVNDLIADKRIYSVEVGIEEGILQASDLEGSKEEREKWDGTSVTLIRLHKLPTMKKVAAELTEKYGVETVWNHRLYRRYDESYLYFLLLLILVSYLAAIAGVAIVRNALQLSTMEQIRDYGNLRCIGATKNQLRGILYFQGAVEVAAALAAALLLSLILTGGLNLLIKSFAGEDLTGADKIPIFRIGALPIPTLFVTSAFFVDLFFLLNENMKRVYGMSPTEAISGHYRFLNVEVKPTKARIIRELLGIEGEYAYKNLVRNPFRLWKNVGILSITMAFITAILMITGSRFNTLSAILDSESAYYQIQVRPDNFGIIGTGTYVYDKNPEKSFLHWNTAAFDRDTIRYLSENQYVTDVQPLYQSHLVTCEKVLDHLDPYMTENSNLPGQVSDDRYSMGIDNIKPGLSWDFRAFSEKEKAGYEEKLLEGTMDVSDQGIVLINGAPVPIKGEKYDEYGVYHKPSVWNHVTDFKIGDEIRIPNPVRIEKKMKEWVGSTLSNDAVLIAMYREEYPDDTATDEWILNHESYDFVYFRRKLCCEAYSSWYEEVMADGDYRTYRIEGILSEDPLYQTEYNIPIFLLPEEEYFDLTGRDENTGITTFNLHVSHPFLFALGYLGNALLSNLGIPVDPGKGVGVLNSAGTYGYKIFYWILDLLSASTKYLLIFLGLLIFLFIAFVNIRNATRNSFFLRRKEFAQLYVIGCTKQTLVRMMSYEGIISALISILIGGVISFPSVFLLKMEDYQFVALKIQWWLYPLALLFAAIPILLFYGFAVSREAKKMKINPATDMIVSGE